MTRGWGALVAAVLLVPVPAYAQGTMFGALGIAVAHAYESNILAQPKPVPPTSDFVTRIGPLAEAGYRSNRFRIAGQYEAAADERYWRYPAFTRRLARQQSHAELAYAVTSHIRIGASGDYVDTYTPVELGVLEAFLLGRVRAQRLTVHPGVAYAWSSASNLSFDYDYAREGVAAFAPAIIQTPRVVLFHETSRQTGYRMSYRSRTFASADGGQQRTHAMALGMDRQVGRASRIELDAGPRLSDGRLFPDVSVVLRHPLRRGGELSVGYAETDGFVLGQTGILEMRQLRAGMQFQLTRTTRLDVTPTLFRTEHAPLATVIGAVEMTSVTQMNSHLALMISAQAGRQQGDLGGAYTRIPYYSVMTTLRVTMSGGRDRAATPPADDGPQQPSRPEIVEVR